MSPSSHSGSLSEPLRPLAPPAHSLTVAHSYRLQSLRSPASSPLCPADFTSIMPDPKCLTASATAFHTPPYLSSDLILWFNILESWSAALIKASQISSRLTKYTPCCQPTAPLSPLLGLRHCLYGIYTSDQPYEDLKTALLQCLQFSITTYLWELLSKEELGSEKPSVLLCRMTQLLGDKYQQRVQAALLLMPAPCYPNQSLQREGHTHA